MEQALLDFLAEDGASSSIDQYCSGHVQPSPGD